MAYSFVCALTIYILIFGGYWIIQKHLPTKQTDTKLFSDEKNDLQKTIIDIVIEFAMLNRKVKEDLNDEYEDESKSALISMLQDSYLKMKKMIGQYLILEGLDPEYQENVELSDSTGRIVRLYITSTRVYKDNIDDIDPDYISEEEEAEDNEHDSEEDVGDEYESNEVDDYELDEGEVDDDWDWEEEVEVSWYLGENNSQRTHPTYDF